MRLITAALLFLWAATAVYAQTSNLDQAKSVYREFEQKQWGIVDSAFDRRIKEATRDGDLDLISTLKIEQARFKSSRELPESATMKSFGQKYEKAIEGAKKKLTEAYTREIKIKTKAGEFANATRLQAELDRLGIAAPSPDQPAPVKPTSVKPSPAKPAAASGPEIVVRSAIWKQIGAMAGNQTQDVRTMLQQCLEQRKAFEPNQFTLSLLDGRPVSKAVFLNMSIHGVTFEIQLEENSTIHLREATPSELNSKGTQIGNTRMETLSVFFRTTDSSVGSDRKAAVMTPLLTGAAIEVSTRTLGELKFGTPKELVMLFRIGDTVLEIQSAEGTRMAIKY